MTPEEMRAKSATKVKQIMELMKVLSIRVEPKRRITPEGFIEDLVFWIDDEKYPAAPVQGAGGAGPEGAVAGGSGTADAGPLGETAELHA